MEMLSRATRHAALVVGLLVVFLTLMSYQVNNTRVESSARGAVLTLAAPLQRLFAAGWGGLTEGWRRYVAGITAVDDLDEARGELVALRRENAALRSARSENIRLRSLLDLTARSQQPAIAAQVVYRDPGHRFEALTVNRGSRDGVKVNAPVLASDGSVLGRVITLTPLTAQIQLITDPLSGTGAKLADSRAPGVVQGNGNEVLSLAYVSTSETIEPGDVIVTSGDDHLYPPGIVIGTVTDVGVGPAIPNTPTVPLARDETALFLEIRVIPYADVLRVEEVLLLPPIEESE